MHLSTPTTLTLVVLCCISVFGITLADKDSILYSISTALLVSCIFYTGTVVIPEIQRQKRVKNRLLKLYSLFKKSCIDLFLISSNSQDYCNRENLLDHEEFKRYFSVRINESQQRWDLVTSSINNGDYIFEELVNQFEFLIHEVNHTRLSVDIFDNDVDAFFSRINQTVHRIKATKAGTDDYKYFCRTLWSIFTRWDYVSGQRDDDFIEAMLQKL